MVLLTVPLGTLQLIGNRWFVFTATEDGVCWRHVNPLDESIEVADLDMVLSLCFEQEEDFDESDEEETDTDDSIIDNSEGDPGLTDELRQQCRELGRRIGRRVRGHIDDDDE